MASSGRATEHQRSDQLEQLLRFFEDQFLPLEQRATDGLTLTDAPILFIVGCARSGSTLVYQYLSQSGLFTFPTNFVSRFYYAPYLGAKLQQMLVDYDFRGEILGGMDSDPFASSLGKTQGPKAPHEFWYFWRRFFPFGEIQQLKPGDLKQVDGDSFLREWRAFQSVEGKPLLAKAMICNWHLSYLASLDPRIHFLHIERDVLANASSLLKARQEFYGDINRWYSFKPPGYEATLKLSPENQVHWQVRETNQAIHDELKQVNQKRLFHIDYKSFCENPKQLLQDILNRWGMKKPVIGCPLPERFDCRDQETASA